MLLLCYWIVICVRRGEEIYFVFTISMFFSSNPVLSNPYVAFEQEIDGNAWLQVTQTSSCYPLLFFGFTNNILLKYSMLLKKMYSRNILFLQAPPSMKAVLQAAWLLTNSLGNLIVMVISAIGQLPNQVHTCVWPFFRADARFNINCGLWNIIITMKKW